MLKTYLKYSSLLLSIPALIYLSGGIFLLQIGLDFSQARLNTIYQYWVYYGDQDGYVDIFIESIFLAFVIVFIPTVIILAPKRRSAFGDAKLASWWDIKKAGLFAESGILLGKFNGRYLVFDKGLHVSMTAPTGAGKGVSFVIPNLLWWRHSTVTMDVKMENWQLTSGWREKQGQKCYLFAPGTTDYKTHRCNPLSYVSSDINFRVDDLSKVATMHFPDKDRTDTLWTAGPRNLFLGIALYILDTGGKLTLGNILRTSLTGGDPKDFFIEEIERLKEEGTPLSRECVLSLLGYTSISADNTRSGILAGFRSGLELYMNPLIDAATSENDFDLRDIRKRRMSIYIGVAPTDLERFTPLIRLFFDVIIDLNTRELPAHNKKLKVPVLLMMDEFAQIMLKSVVKGASLWRGYGIQICPILQSPAQLSATFGKDEAESFMTNMSVKLALPPNASDTKTAEEISKWLGYTSATTTSRSRPSGILSKRESSYSESDRQRPLFMPQEISELKEGLEIVIVDKVRPIIADMVYFYKDRLFVDRLKSVSPSLRKIRGLPKKKDYENAVVSGELAAFVPTILINNEDHFTMPTIKNTFKFDWDDITPPTTGYMDKDALDSYTDALCAGAGVIING